MCGIIGIIGNAPVRHDLLEGLRRLEYRGYDSAGIATVEGGVIQSCRAKGKLAALAAEPQLNTMEGTIGIGHTRWATHGVPSVTNAHPHSTAEVTVVHNGIIENFGALREYLQEQGIVFETDTDTEVIPHLITLWLRRGLSPKDAVTETLSQLEGAFAIAVLFSNHDDVLIGARRGSPLAIGYGEGAMYIGSDALALAPLTQKITYLEEGDWVELYRDHAIIHNTTGAIVERPVELTSVMGASIGKDNYRHFMLKEIHEQPKVIGEALNAYYNPVSEQLQLPDMPFDLASLERITIVACGTSYYAGLVAQYWFESVAQIPADVYIASEFRYRNIVLPKNGVTIGISQSGETADTLAALNYAREKGQKIISVVNVPESSMARQSDAILRTFAGPEIGVASTKAFTTQLVALACFCLAIAGARKVLSDEERVTLLHALAEVPGRSAHVLQDDSGIQAIAKTLSESTDVLYIGRGTAYAIALESALKLKEVSYIHAEAIAAGELKHGTIALIDESVPVVVVAPPDDLFAKTRSNAQEVAARRGRLVTLTDRQGAQALESISDEMIVLPEVHPFVAPILYVIPAQLLAYHVAVFKGTDVDQPRNLAKSVTVE